MRTRLRAVRVQEVILNNETNPVRYKQLGDNDAVGTILYSRLNQELPTNGSTDYLGFAKPLFAGITSNVLAKSDGDICHDHGYLPVAQFHLPLYSF